MPSGLILEITFALSVNSMHVLTLDLACRYVVYLESMAWSTNGRHKFSCGSVVISNKMGYYEFFTRELKPGVHYVEVDPNNLCDDLVTKVRGRQGQSLFRKFIDKTCKLASNCIT